MHHWSKVWTILQLENNPGETLSVNTEEKYQYRRRGTSLQIASEFMQYIPVRHW